MRNKIEDAILRTYLDQYPSHYEYDEVWPLQGNMHVRLCLGNELPPAHVSSSMLAIVFDPDGKVIVLAPDNWSGNIAHLVIGGRPEGDEAPEETVIREVGEETGWRVQPVRMVGFRHFRHLEPDVAGNDRPYPDFVQPIFTARGTGHDAAAVIQADHIPWEALEYDAVVEMLEPGSRVLLEAAHDLVD